MNLILTVLHLVQNSWIFLSKYIDWYIRKRISEDQYWQSIEVVFSNEKSPGEGEHKNY